MAKGRLKKWWNSKKSLKKQMEELEASRPKYVIQDEVFDNQALAKARAFGRDRTIQMAEENVDQDVASAVSQAKNISGSTTAVLDTLRAIATGGMGSKRNLAMQEVGVRDQRAAELYNANSQLAEERDKEWNFNTNEPYQNKVQALRDRRKFRQELAMKAIDVAGTVGAGALTGGTSLAGKGASQVAGGGGAPMEPIDGYGNSWSTYG